MVVDQRIAASIYGIGSTISISFHGVVSEGSFFYSDSLLREVNKTIIALVPKIPNATKLSDYRPISCCNTIYKCLCSLQKSNGHDSAISGVTKELS